MLLLLLAHFISLVLAQEPGLGVTYDTGLPDGVFQCFRGWYQELENEFGFHTAETWNLGFALHDEGSVCGGYGGYCPDAQDSSMRERDAAALIVRSGHNALTAYEIHDHSRDCPPLQFCVQPLSYIYFKTRAYWPILWRYTGNEVEDRLCVRTSYPGYVWIQGISAEGWRSS